MPDAKAPGWSTPDDVAARLRRRWTSGELLSAYGRGEPFTPVAVPLRGPRGAEVGVDLSRVRAWAERLERAAPGRFALEWRTVGGRTVGRSEVPARAVVASYAEAWRLLDVEGEVASYDALLAATAGEEAASAWALQRPRAALAVGEEWPTLLAALHWLRTHRGSGRYLREISAPGVDTKFVERHRAPLAAMLEVPGRAEGFLDALGLHDRPARVRLRWGAGHPGLPALLSDASLRVDELSALPVEVSCAVVVENEVTFLSAPVPAGGVVFFGEGFRVSRVGSVRWLADAPVHYWGDLDTHGFAILDQLRAWLPQTRSFLMDAATLLAHRERWVTEPTPTSADLQRLDPAERSLYEDLVTDRWADRVRLEQERVDWAWARERWPGNG